jgi:KUP system potassium uptake protein
VANALHADGVPQQDTRRLPAIVVLTALGVVYGDVGTNTLYGLKQAADAGGGPVPETVNSIGSLISWALHRDLELAAI